MRGSAGLYDVPAVLDKLGIAYRQLGEEGWAQCPGHVLRTGKEDGNPSWSVNLESGLHHCFSCGYSGDLPGLVGHVMHLGYTAAEAWLTDPRMLTAALHRQMRPTSVWKDAPEPIRFNFAALALPPEAELEKREISKGAAQRYEILWDGEGFVLPIRDREHRLLGYQVKRGAFVRNRPRRVAKGKTLFGLAAFTGRRAVLVESPLDAARLWSAGIDGAVASFGADVTEDQIDLIVSIADSAVVALDDDNAGETNADRVETQLAKRIWPVKRFRYPAVYDGKDPGDLTDKQVLEGVTGARTRLERLTGA